MRWFALIVALLLCASLIDTSHAQSTPAGKQAPATSDAAICQNSEDMNARIAACTRSIEKTKIQRDRALAHAHRAGAHLSKREFDEALKDANTSIEIEPTGLGHYVRGSAYQWKGAHDRAIKEFTRAIELKPDLALAYSGRCVSYQFRDEQERALEDCNKAVQLAPAHPSPYNNRGFFYANRKEYDKALADYNIAAGLSDKNSNVFTNRGRLFVDMGEIERAIPDLDRAVLLNAKSPYAYGARGLAYAKKKDDGRALSDFATALTLDDQQSDVYFGRSEVYLRNNKLDLAIADLRQVLKLPARRLREREAQVRAAELLTSLTTKTGAKPSVPIAEPSLPVLVPLGSGRRVALVLGNSNYVAVGVLKNPANDARVVAEALRRIGFSEVMERHDLGLSEMTAALKDFGDKAANADWAVIYFAGHGLEMGGAAYLVPTDAKLEKDSYVPDETIPLERMLQKTEGARKLRLVVLDACRNNPFVTRMVRTGGAQRSIGQGLPPLEVEGDILVAYATKHGMTALDGDGDNSPYALALAKHLALPDVDIRVMFGRVRDTVRLTTNKRQEPYTYGSIGGDLHFFAVSAVAAK